MADLLISLLMALSLTITNVQSEPVEMKATAYCLNGITASGLPVQNGICAMNDRAMIGKTIAIYQRLPDGEMGELIGTYLVGDTGCKKGVVDVWQPDLESCQAFMDKVYQDGCKGNVYLVYIGSAKNETD